MRERDEDLPSLDTIDLNIREWRKQLKEQGLSDEEVEKKLYKWISENF
ncbi:hypothetical protein V8046_004002 [Vibrio parahaemolyticus]|uniref:Uncharacterized protein n=1 Tax=Vibrio rotiferianus TaxID=190895 RepID=A0A510I9G9_9VIBR|nr:hypothetical protein [Vibrio rotiferianus]EJG1876038.1 hypothetical protein [Vibrio parahaemolyticus]ELA9387067.1 hypothetical protein [Vibrio parahaemolyticus]ELA9893992.1 hypothetical protein [Vibrio parahaemolyticus]BBL90373.1 hypothetical protein VroAM7_30260 [Vibrio rotiferianus]HCG5510777.1 hypothetical protein [Vibrio parahaemolyticus]